MAVTVVQTKEYVDALVLVPVFRHAVKRDLLPFDDRCNMCRLAVQSFASNISVSTVERDVGASNGAMLRALKATYPPGTRFVWICGDDFFQWMHTDKGLETLAEVDGLIVQRRLHRLGAEGSDKFYKDPIDEQRVQATMRQRNLTIDYIYGELPHFSSSLVRRAPGHWKSFLTTAVATYLDERPSLLAKLMENLHADAAQEKQQQQQQQQQQPPDAKKHKRMPSLLDDAGHSLSGAVVMRGLEAVHLLQKERGHSSLFLSTAAYADKLTAARAKTDTVVQEIMDASASSTNEQELQDFPEVRALAAELERIPLWLTFDRQVLEQYAAKQNNRNGNGNDSNNNTNQSAAAVDAWLARLDLVEKFDPRIDVLMGGTVRALTEILQMAHQNNQQTNNNDNKPSSSSSFNRDVPELFRKWLEGKEMLGRERAVVCCGGAHVPALVRASLKMRQRTLQIIDTKERKIARVLELQQTAGTDGMATMMTAPEALHKLLEQLTRMEYTLLGAFAPSTPVALVHRLVASGAANDVFDVKQFFQASTAAIDFLLSFAKALAASAIASA